MGSRKRNRRPTGQPPVQPTAKRNWTPILVALLGVGLVAAILFLAMPNRQPDAANGLAHSAPTADAAAGPTVSTVANPKVASSSSNSGYDVLKGKWQRPDGGYIVEVKSVTDSGKMDASYRNPRSINVSKAEASRDGTNVKVFIELRDVNYPGSTYDLTYDPQSDMLKGIYYQAARQQRFEVAFVRID